MSKMEINDVENAAVALFQATLQNAYSKSVDVKTIGKRDFSDDGAITLKAPAVRIRFAGAEYDPLRDNQRLTYEAEMAFEAWCFDVNLRSQAEARLACEALAMALADQVAGARLKLQDGTLTQPITLKSVEPLMSEEDPADQLYIVIFTVKGIAQFSGQNARPQ
jgi:hypothetical protein